MQNKCDKISKRDWEKTSGKRIKNAGANTL
jgi:hypothetical protein